MITLHLGIGLFQLLQVLFDTTVAVIDHAGADPSGNWHGGPLHKKNACSNHTPPLRESQ